MIEVRGVTKTYGKKDNAFNALSDVSFSIPDGASVAILGKSGSGKSTLMHIMSGLDRPSSGSVFIDGKNILKMKQKEVDKFRSKKMSFIFQSFFIQANENCYNNVSLPLEIANVSVSRRRKRVDAALKAVQLFDKKKAKARELSGGQKQRLAIARAIVNSPKILFADEPTGNLDSITGRVVENLLFNYHKKFNITFVLVTHDPELSERCDIQLHIKDGRIDAVKGIKK